MVDCFFDLKLSVSLLYDMWLCISAGLRHPVSEQFRDTYIVYPLQIPHNVIITATIDNIHHNFSFTTEAISFHGIGILFIQCPNSSMEGRYMHKIVIDSYSTKLKVPYS